MQLIQTGALIATQNKKAGALIKKYKEICQLTI